MCWQCDNPNGTTEEYLDELRETISDHGMGGPVRRGRQEPFAYTIGLHDRGLPELLMTGLDVQVATRVLNSIAHMIVDDGTVLAPAMHIDYQDRFLIEVVEVEHPEVHLKFTVRLCGSDVRLSNWCGPTTVAAFPGARMGSRSKKATGARVRSQIPSKKP